jgi:hypothetical protein
MSELFKNLNRNNMGGKGSADSIREAAVGAALALIEARVSSSASVHLSQELENLSKYADQILEALKVK